MKYSALLILLAVAGFGADATIGQSFDQSLSDVEHEFVSLADAMPANAYAFAPSSGEFKNVRTFGQQVKHVAATNYMIAGAILGTKPPVDIGQSEAGPASLATKEQILTFLKDSFAYLHKGMASITAQNMMQQVPSPFGGKPTARASIALEAAGHCFDHYGQMVVYARMNGIVPPASR
jgi:DinB superfamily